MVQRTLTHGFAIIGAIGLLYYASTQSFFPATVQPKSTLDISVESTSGGTVYIEVIQKKDLSRITVHNTDGELMFVQIPSVFSIQSVRGMKLEDIAADSILKGFNRYVLGEQSSITLEGHIAADSLLLHNSTKMPLLVKYTYIQPELNTIITESKLVYDSTVTLW